jgi:hypothetical protein
VFRDPDTGRPVGGSHDHGPHVPCPVTAHLTVNLELALGDTPAPDTPPPPAEAPVYVAPDDVAGTAG